MQTLKAEFEALKMKDADELDEFCIKLSSLVTRIRALGDVIEESYIGKKLLRAVPPKFLQLASTIEQFGNVESMSVEEAIGSLKAHEERLRGQSESSNSQMLLTEEECLKKEWNKGQLLLTKEEWQKRYGKGGSDGNYGQRNGRNGGGNYRGRIEIVEQETKAEYDALTVMFMVTSPLNIANQSKIKK